MTKGGKQIYSYSGDGRVIRMVSSKLILRETERCPERRHVGNSAEYASESQPQVLTWSRVLLFY